MPAISATAERELVLRLDPGSGAWRGSTFDKRARAREDCLGRTFAARRDAVMPAIRSTDLHFGDDERHVFVDQIASGIDPRNDGSPTEVLPEPGETVKRRFGRDKEVLTGYSAMWSIAGPGKRHTDRPILMYVVWMAPEPLDEATFRQAVPELPSTWKLDFEIQPEGATAVLDDVRSTPPSEIARVMLDTLLALGATLPTGRWRTTWQSLYTGGSE
jgi:hypothetical protein